LTVDDLVYLFYELIPIEPTSPDFAENQSYAPYPADILPSDSLSPVLESVSLENIQKIICSLNATNKNDTMIADGIFSSLDHTMISSEAKKGNKYILKLLNLTSATRIVHGLIDTSLPESEVESLLGKLPIMIRAEVLSVIANAEHQRELDEGVSFLLLHHTLVSLLSISR
jgi:hypothetical protein